jgi:hypothetical protein
LGWLFAPKYRSRRELIPAATGCLAADKRRGSMDNERIPRDPYRSGLSDDDFGRPSRFETEAQIDPDLTEGRASNGKIALLALAIAVVLGAVFYGLNNTSVHEASNAPPAQTAAQPNPAQPPKANTEPGMTTGSAASEKPAMPQGAPNANPAAPAK